MFQILKVKLSIKPWTVWGFEGINEVRQGKYFEIDTKEDDKKKAEKKVEEMCKKLLANLVIEDFKIIGSQ